MYDMARHGRHANSSRLGRNCDREPFGQLHQLGPIAVVDGNAIPSPLGQRAALGVARQQDFAGGVDSRTASHEFDEPCHLAGEMVGAAHMVRVENQHEHAVSELVDR